MAIRNKPFSQLQGIKSKKIELSSTMTCEEYQKIKDLDPEDRKFMDFAKGMKFKMCPKCKFWVEKSQGCDHMKCRCGKEFCYKCGGDYPNCDCRSGGDQIARFPGGIMPMMRPPRPLPNRVPRARPIHPREHRIPPNIALMHGIPLEHDVFIEEPVLPSMEELEVWQEANRIPPRTIPKKPMKHKK